MNRLSPDQGLPHSTEALIEKKLMFSNDHYLNFCSQLIVEIRNLSHLTLDILDKKIQNPLLTKSITNKLSTFINILSEYENLSQHKLSLNLSTAKQQLQQLTESWDKTPGIITINEISTLSQFEIWIRNSIIEITKLTEEENLLTKYLSALLNFISESQHFFVA